MIQNALALVQAAAEPPSGTRTGGLGAALTALVDRRFRVSGPGVTHAVLTRAVPGMRWNSREWSIATTWEVHLHADMRVSTLVDINVEMNETGATFSSHNRHKVVGADPFADTMHVPQLTLEQADANTAAAAKAIVAVCKKMLLKRMDAHDDAYASAEPRPRRTAILDATTYAIVAAPIEWSGYGDTFAISEDGERAAVAVTAESDQVDLLRGRPLTASDADHQSVYPGDRFCEYRQSQIGQPVVWPSKEFFYI